jgi:hypothetical protein
MLRISEPVLMNARRVHMVRPEPKAPWMARAVADYGQFGADELASRLAEAVHALTGKQPARELIWVSPTQRAAAVSVDGVRFHWEQGRLVLLRPCVQCGLGQLASPPLHSRVDLGYALAAWQPRHPDCEQEDPIDW